jgi:hypothetical protein
MLVVPTRSDTVESSSGRRAAVAVAVQMKRAARSSSYSFDHRTLRCYYTSGWATSSCLCYKTPSAEDIIELDHERFL